MPPFIKQSSLAGGEISPELFAHTDIEKYAQSAKTMRNFLITPTGVAKNRPGTKYVAAVHNPLKRPRLVPFKVSNEAAYVIEFGEAASGKSLGYVRILNSNLVIQAATGFHEEKAASSKLFANGGWATDSLVGKTLTNLDTGGSGTITGNTSYSVAATLSGGSPDNLWDVGEQYRITGQDLVLNSPYGADDLPRLRFATRNDIMIVTHANHPPMELRRLASGDWEFVPFTVKKTVKPPTGVQLEASPGFSWTSGSATDHPEELWEWVVTSVNSRGAESEASSPLTDPNAVLYPDREKPRIEWTPPTSGDTPSEYRVYRGKQGQYGFIASTEDANFTDPGTLPDYSIGPPDATDPLVIDSEEQGESIESEFGAQSGSPLAQEALKETAPEAHDDRYSYVYRVTLAIDLDDYYDWQTLTPNSSRHVPNEYLPTVTLRFQHRPETGGAWTAAFDRTIRLADWYVNSGITLPINQPGGTIHTIARTFVDIVAVDGQGDSSSNTQFRIEEVSIVEPLNAGYGMSVSWDAERVRWNPPGSSASVKTYPAAVAFFEQRLIFGGFSHDRQLIRGSQTGDYFSFDRSFGLQDDDRLDLILASSTLDEIRDLVPLEALQCFTAGAEWVIRGANGPLTPSSFDMKPRTRYGSSWVRPIAIGQAVLFVADRARQVREFTYDPNGITATQARDMTILAEHLFRSYQIEEWDFADVPYQIMWAVRGDGSLCALTYVRDQNVFAWHRHESEGFDSDGVPNAQFESVACIPEGSETAVYVVVKRTVNGSTVRYIERFASRHFLDDEDYIFLDSALTYDGWNSDAAITVKASGASYAADDSVTLTGVGTSFTAADVGKRIELKVGDDTCRFHVTAYASATSLTAFCVTAVPSSLQNVATADWATAVNNVSGLDHLEAKTVGTLIDGNTGPTGVVSSGTLGLGISEFGAKIQVGLPIEADIEALPVHSPKDSGSLRMAKKIISHIGVEVDNWRGLSLGTSLSALKEVIQRDVSDGFGDIVPENALVLKRVTGSWRRRVQVAIRQSEPLPVTVLSVATGMGLGGNH